MTAYILRRLVVAIPTLLILIVVTFLLMEAAPGSPFIHGKVVHEERDMGKLILTVFSEENKDIEAVAVDGLFFAMRKSLFDTIRFDKDTFDRFHFYDLDICMQVRPCFMASAWAWADET